MILDQIRTYFWLAGGPLAGLALVFAAPFDGLSAAGHQVLGLSTWMIIWWVSECVPLFVTALLPAFILPLQGITAPALATQAYGSSVVFLFLGGFLLSIALEKHGLHHQISGTILRLFGTRKDRVVLGFMVSGAFLSMWISNTASAMIMLPIALALSQRHTDSTFQKALLFGIAYAASIGGIGTIIGTPANAILIGFLQRQGENPFRFSTWMLFALPVLICGLLFTWYFLTRIQFKVSRESISSLSGVIGIPADTANESSSPALRRAAWFIFILMVFAWTMSPYLAGWNLSDTGVALGGSILLFASGVLEARDFSRVQWQILILFGGGLALSEGIQKSGLAMWVGQGFLSIEQAPPLLLVLGIGILVIFLTELLSNTACASIFIPIAAGLGDSLRLESTTLLAVVTLSASLSFMLPMATPPNAVLYTLSDFKIGEMMRVGVWLNLFFALLVSLAASYWLPVVLSLL